MAEGWDKDSLQEERPLKHNLAHARERLKLQQHHVRDAPLAAPQGNGHSTHSESHEDPKGSWGNSTDCWCQRPLGRISVGSHAGKGFLARITRTHEGLTLVGHPLASLRHSAPVPRGCLW